MLGAGKWQVMVMGVVLGVAALTGTWLHGRQNGIASAEQKAMAAYAKSLSIAISQQAAAAKTMGRAVDLAREREAEAIAEVAEVEREAAQREARWRRQREQNPDCDAWMRAPVACRLRHDAADSGES